MGKRVLIITYYFPPRPGVASIRLRGLAKYLPQYGWEPVVLTAALPGEPEPRFNVVQTLYPGDASARWKRKLGLAPGKGFQQQIGIPRALREGRASFTSRVVSLAKAIIAYPDEQKGWCPFAVSAGHDLLKRERFDALLSSSGPATCHLIARELKRRHGIPWVADLRDLWTQNHYYPHGLVRRLFERRLELKTLELADALVTVSEPLAEELKSLHRNKQVLAITNGFDPDEVASVPLTKEFTITYTGALYEGKRDPALLFQAVHELIADGTIDPLNIRIRFCGETPYWLERQVRHYQLGEIVSLHYKVPRDVALSKQRESQVLLLLNWDDSREKGVYTGKIFEYLAAKRPILALGGPGGVVAQLLKETGTGVHVESLDYLKALLRSWYQEYKLEGEVRYKGQWEAVQKYSHREMARKFAHLLDEVTGSNLADY
ncbi:MAG: glycosyltransferase [bacterium]